MWQWATANILSGLLESVPTKVQDPVAEVFQDTLRYLLRGEITLTEDLPPYAQLPFTVLATAYRLSGDVRVADLNDLTVSLAFKLKSGDVERPLTGNLELKPSSDAYEYKSQYVAEGVLSLPTGLPAGQTLSYEARFPVAHFEGGVQTSEYLFNMGLALAAYSTLKDFSASRAAATQTLSTQTPPALTLAPQDVTQVGLPYRVRGASVPDLTVIRRKPAQRLRAWASKIHPHGA